jgi:peptidoglycan/LPS O-acetylase OafA/YrhL
VPASPATHKPETPLFEPVATSVRDRSIDIARMVAAAFIVVYHASETYSLIGGGNVLGRTPWEVVGNLGLWGRVPFFLLLSGYFAAVSLTRRNPTWWEFFKKRLVSLGPPFLFWNAVALVMLAVAVNRGVQFQREHELTVATVLMKLTCIGMGSANGPLWFVRDILLASMLAPLARRCGSWLLIPCLLLVIIPDIPIEWKEMGCPRPSSFGYFGIGMLLYQLPKGIAGQFFPKPLWGFLLILGVGLIHVIFSIYPAAFVGPALGALGILLLGRYFHESWPAFGKWVAENAGASFMIFATNIPYFAVVRQIYFRLPAWVPPLAFMILSAVVLILGVIAFHRWVKNRCPRLLLVLGGGGA